MNDTSKDKNISPLTIFILWHHGFEKGMDYAELLYHHFTRNIKDAFSRDLGIPIRMGIINGNKITGADGHDHEFEYNDYTRTATIFLINSSLVNDADARAKVDEIRKLTDIDDKHLLIPVAIEREALKAGTVLADLQYIRFYDQPESRRENFMMIIIAHELLRLISDKICCDEEGEPRNKVKPPSKFFLSHAKKDGQDITKSIRDHIHKDFPIYTFLDENNIPVGMSFIDAICDEVQQSVLLAIHTDNFSASTWCTQEFEWAKKYNRPVVIVDMLTNGDMRVYPYFGNVSIIKSTVESLKGQLTDYQRDVKISTLLLDNIVFTALKESLRARYHEEFSKALIENSGITTSRRKISIHPPELLTLVHLKELAIEKDLEYEIKLTKGNNALDSASLEHMKNERELNMEKYFKPDQQLPLLFVYPNPPIPFREQEILERADRDFQKVNFVTPTQLMMLDPEMMDGNSTSSDMKKIKDLSDFKVSISISNLNESPLSNHFIRDMVVELAKQLLHLNAGLVYGGDLNFQTDNGFNYTEAILGIARSYLYKSGEVPEKKVVNYAAFPYYTRVDDTQIAENSAVMEFVKVKPDKNIVDEKYAKELMTVDNEHTFYAKAHCLIKMRMELIERANAHIFMGGKTHGFDGRYSGILEEFLIAVKSGEPIFLIGGFGGVATAIREAIFFGEDSTREYPEALELDFYIKDNEEKVRYIEFFNEHNEEYKIDYLEVKSELLELNKTGDYKFFNNELSKQENERLMKSSDIYEVIRLVLKGLKAVKKLQMNNNLGLTNIN